MKKFLVMLLALMMVLSLAACGGGEDAPEETVNPKLEELVGAQEAAKAAVSELSALLEEYADQVDPEIVTICGDMETNLLDGDDVIAQIKAGELEVEDAAFDDLISSTREVEAWATEVLAQLQSVEDAPAESGNPAFAEQMAELTALVNEITPLYNEAATLAMENGWDTDELTLQELNAVAALIESAQAGIADNTLFDDLSEADMAAMLEQYQQISGAMGDIIARVSEPYAG